jgi:hypothetical protein
MMALLVALNTTAIVVGIVWAVLARRKTEDRENEELDLDRRIALLEDIVQAHGSCIKDGFRDDRDLAERLGRLERLTGHAKQIPDFDDEDEDELSEAAS